MALQAEVLRRFGRQQQALGRPGLASGGLAAQLRRREHVDDRVVGRMDRDQMADPLARELGDDEAMAGQHGGDLVAIGFALGGLAEVDQAIVEHRDLEPEKAQLGRPLRD